jgi:DNA-binding CsgD family transcriptional regulator
VNAISEAIAEAARAATLEELGASAFPALARALGACPVFFAEVANDLRRSEAIAGEHRATFGVYMRDFVLDDPIGLAGLAARSAVSLFDEQVDRRTLRASRVYDEFHRVHDFEHHMLLRIYGEPLPVPGALMMGFTRGQRLREFGRSEARIAARALPAFRGAAQRIRRASAAARLPSAGLPIATLDRCGRLLFLSPLAEKLLAPGLARDGRLPAALVRAAQRVASLSDGNFVDSPSFSVSFRLPDGTWVGADLGTARSPTGETIALCHIHGDACRGSSAVAGGRGLTAAENDVLAALALGLSNAEIGHRLSVSVETVKTHLYRAFRKLGVTSRTQAVLALGRR